MDSPDYLKTISRLARKSRLRANRLWHKAQGKPCVHFLHLGKTGGSAVKYAIEHSANPHARYVIYLHPHATKLRDVPENQRFFFFLRDPISRFVSGFYSRQRQGQPRYFLPWTSGEKAAFAHFNTPNELGLALSSIDPGEKTNAEAAMKNILHVKDSYWYWFESREYFMSRVRDLFFAGFQEQLSRDFETLKTRLGLPYLELPADDVHAHRNPAGLDTSLDEQAVENLTNWYAGDYDFVNLCAELVREQEARHCS
jgi:hypothetical protein